MSRHVNKTSTMFFAAALITCLCCTGRPAAALDLAVVGSYWDAEDAEDGVWGAGAKLGIPIICDYVQIETRAYWVEGDGGRGFGDVEIVPVDLGAAIHFIPDGVVDPYVAGGASYVFADADNVDLDSDWAAYAGGGLNVRLADPFYLTAEVLYRFIELEGDSRFDDEEWEANSLTVNTGLMFRF